jgi:hypothetical protein
MNSFYKNNNEIRNKNIYIDSTFISNSKGSEFVNTNPMYRKKKVTKISSLCDDNNVILGLVPFDSHIHDVKTIDKTINILPKCIKNKINLIGDKGYITSTLFTFNNKKIKLITPYRKNMKKKLTTQEKNKLKKRNKIEHVFQKIKKYNRTQLRKEKKINNFMSFLYIIVLFENIKILNKIFICYIRLKMLSLF